jgi:hypothetical protein
MGAEKHHQVKKTQKWFVAADVPAALRPVAVSGG